MNAVASNPILTDVNAAVLNLNKTLAKNGYRFVLFIEGFGLPEDADTLGNKSSTKSIDDAVDLDDDDEDDDDDDYDDSDIVAPNSEVMAYPIEKLTLSLGGFDPKEDSSKDLTAMVYSSQYNNIMSGALLGSVMAADDKVFHLVKYGYMCGKMEAAAVSLMEYDTNDSAQNSDEDYDYRDLDDDD